MYVDIGERVGWIRKSPEQVGVDILQFTTFPMESLNLVIKEQVKNNAVDI